MTDVRNDGLTRDDLLVLRRIMERLPQLREMAEAIGADSTAQLLERAEILVNGLLDPRRSIETH